MSYRAHGDGQCDDAHEALARRVDELGVHGQRVEVAHVRQGEDGEGLEDRRQHPDLLRRPPVCSLDEYQCRGESERKRERRIKQQEIGKTEVLQVEEREGLCGQLNKVY